MWVTPCRSRRMFKHALAVAKKLQKLQMSTHVPDVTKKAAKCSKMYMQLLAAAIKYAKCLKKYMHARGFVIKYNTVESSMATVDSTHSVL